MTKEEIPMSESSTNYNRLFTGKISTATFLTVYTLHMLSKGEKMCGKEICNKIEDRFRGTWTPSHGMIYPILRQLEAENIVKARWMDKSKKTKRLYWLTDEGKKVLDEQLIQNENLFKESLAVMLTMVGDLYKEMAN
jgi:PadR family transcriptional regulator PadR